MITHLKQLFLPLLTISAISLFGCSSKDRPLAETTDGGGSGFPDQELFQAEVRLTNENFPRLTLVAKHMSRFEQQNLLLMDGGIKADVFDNFGNHTAVITADEGEVIETTNQLSARGNVVVVSDSGIVLKGEELQYNPNIGRIVSDGFVTITSPTDSLSGYGFTAAPDLTDWEIKNTSGTTWRSNEPDTASHE